MSNLSQCKDSLLACYDEGVRVLNDTETELSQAQIDALTIRTSELHQKIREIETHEREEHAIARDAHLQALKDESKRMKDSADAHANVATVINILANAINITTRILTIIQPSVVMSGFITRSHSMAFLPGGMTVAEGEEQDGSSEAHIKAERDFLRCMVSYLLYNPIQPNDWENYKAGLS
jgi:hypothetical protein